MKAILLPTDFSKNSMNAIEFAMNYFEKETCDFYIINVQKASSFVTDDMMSVSFSSTIYSTIVDAAKKSIENVITMIRSKYNNKNHTFHSIVDYDNFIDSIDQASKLNNIDLIVMGTKGASGLSKYIFGSNTVRVMQRLEIPVLAIPEGCEFVIPDKTAILIDNIFKKDINKLTPLKSLLSGFNTTLTGLSFKGDKFNSSNKFLEALFKKVEYKELNISDNDLFKSTEKFLHDNNFKMLAILNEKHSFIERLLTTHDVERFGFNIQIPFFVMDA